MSSVQWIGWNGMIIICWLNMEDTMDGMGWIGWDSQNEMELRDERDGMNKMG